MCIISAGELIFSVHRRFGVVAQLGERYHGMVEAVGSSPIDSTRRDSFAVPFFFL